MRVSESCSIFLMRKLFNIFEQLQVKSLCSESPGSAASRCAAAGDTAAEKAAARDSERLLVKFQVIYVALS